LCSPSHAIDVTSKGVLQNEAAQAAATFRDWTGREIAEFPPISEAISDVRVSPDLKVVALAGKIDWANVGCHDGIVTFNAGRLNRRPRTLAWCSPSLSSSPTSVSWSPDGKRIVFSAGGSIYLLETSDPEPRIISPKGIGPRWSTTDDRIAFIDGDVLVILRAEALDREIERHLLPVTGLMPSGLEWSGDGRFLSIVHRTSDQPRDGRVRTALGILDTQSWQYRESSARLWGNQPSLRWVDLPPDHFDDLVKIRTASCKGGVDFFARPH
jgi:WD40 repeat protein